MCNKSYDEEKEQSVLISIIVPVYKVEEYLDKCVESIVNQTYKNLEIILVDDGSPDSCGSMCDNWGKKDNRISVLHKKNGGLSDARNAGINVAKGKYIGFVDSDDYIEPRMFELLVNTIEKSSADISTCFVVTERKENPQKALIYEKIKVLQREEAIIDLFTKNGYVRHAAWNKLYKKEIFDDIKFPVGRLFEDAAVMYKVFDSIKNIAVIKAELYHYVQRAGSICNNYYKKEAVLHRMENAMEAFFYFEGRVDLQNAAYVWNATYITELCLCSYNNGDKKTAEYGYRQFKNISKISKIKKLNNKLKMKIFIFLINPYLFYKIKNLENKNETTKTVL